MWEDGQRRVGWRYVKVGVLLSANMSVLGTRLEMMMRAGVEGR